MPKHPRSAVIRQFILREVAEGSKDIPAIAAEKFKIKIPAINFHLRQLRSEGVLECSGNTSGRTYGLKTLSDWSNAFKIGPTLTEDAAWDLSKPSLGTLPENVLSIWNGGFTEMFNNAIEHSEGTRIIVRVRTTAINSEVMILDDGIGIFKKIQQALNLADPRHAILELSKGKFTTDPEHHSGEGIFFTSRMFDSFSILSEGLFFSHKIRGNWDWLLQQGTQNRGTGVWMQIANDSARTPKEVYEQFAGPENDYNFEKTIVPVRMAQYKDLLVSRSQAKRILVGLEKFKIVSLNFEGVESVGQAFADEIFRVFANAHPEINVDYTHANAYVRGMIQRARHSERAIIESANALASSPVTDAEGEKDK
jgi:hypothetical protein